MKHAEACWARPWTPMLNHTGELNEAFCVTRMCLSSAANVSRSSSVAKRPCPSPQAAIESTTRSTICLTDHSRLGVFCFPRKYFSATMFVAFCDHDVGNSTSSCSKDTLPVQDTSEDFRRSQWISS
jgi:hypothetical protein